MIENLEEIKEKTHLPILKTEPTILIPFPTKKQHVSFSEIKLFHECSFRHKLKYIDGINMDSDSVHTTFGKVIHDVSEHFFMTREMQIERFEPALRAVWLEHKFADAPTNQPVEGWIKSGLQILTELPAWIDETFPGWLPFAAEELLMEHIDQHPDILLKGFVDVVIRVPKKKQPKNATEIVYDFWIIDLKTCSYFWRKDKIMDHNVYNQVVIYKYFWCMKHGIDPKNVKTAFALLRRAVPKKSTGCCLLLTVSSGPVTLAKAVKWVNNMIATVKRGIAIKNRYNCQWCPYAKTDFCPEF
jgi:hypothetical protein